MRLFGLRRPFEKAVSFDLSKRQVRFCVVLLHCRILFNNDGLPLAQDCQFLILLCEN